MPGKAAGHNRDIRRPHMGRGENRLFELIGCPGCSLFGIEASREEGLKHGLIGGMYGQELALKVRGQFNHLKADLFEHSLILIAIGL